MAESVLVIEAGRTERHYWADLWRYRELFLILAWRDVSVRYKQTVLGVAWAVLRPLFTMVVFTIVFGKVAKLPSDGETPYAVMVFSAMLPWYLFTSSMSGAADSIVGSAGLISKVYFPRLIVPASALVTALIDFSISLVIMIGLMFWYQVVPGLQLILIPVFVLLTLVVSLGPGLWISALNVKYRDFRYIVPIIMQFGLYISPVGFSSTLVPESWRLLYNLNPMVGVIDGFRWCILGGERPFYLPGFCVGLSIALFFLWFGVRQFRKMEQTFVDLF